MLKYKLPVNYAISGNFLKKWTGKICYGVLELFVEMEMKQRRCSKKTKTNCLNNIIIIV